MSEFVGECRNQDTAISIPSITIGKHLLPTPGQGFARLMETQPRQPVIAAGLRGGRSGSGGDGRERRYYISFRGEDPSARTFVDIPVSAAPPRRAAPPSRAG